MRTLAIVGFLVGLLGACAGDRGPHLPTEDAGVTPDADAGVDAGHEPPAPDCLFTVTPEAISLEDLVVDFGHDFHVTFTNVGTEPQQRCRLSAHLDRTHSALVFEERPPAEEVVEPGESRVFTLVVLQAGFDGAPLEGALILKTNSEDTPEVTVPIHISPSFANCLSLDWQSHDFGAVGIAPTCVGSETAYVLISNRCNAPIEFERFHVAEPAGQPAGGPQCPGSVACPEFILTELPTVFGGVEPLRFKYRPIDIGPDTGRIEIDWTFASRTYTTPISLTGEGAEALQQTDIWTQPAPKLDVLVVLDGASSMAPHRASIAANLAALATYIEDEGYNWRLAATTMDPSQGAQWLQGTGHPAPVLHASSVNLEAQLAARVAAASSSTSSPRCFEQAVTALSPPLSTGANAGFRRNDAKLWVLCVTDRTDHSPLPVLDYLDALVALTPGKVFLQVHGVGGFSSGCPGDTGRLSEAAMLTSGAMAELCDPDWHTQIQFSTFGFPGGSFLSGIPDLSLGPIEISVDGEPLPPVDEQGAQVWTYDPVANFFEFHDPHRPRPGKSWSATYWVSCSGS